jgi:hypothetical protein
VLGAFAIGALIGAALWRPAYSYYYPAYGYYPTYGHGYGYPAYAYGYGYPAYTYGYAYPSYSYGGYYRPYYRAYANYWPYVGPGYQERGLDYTRLAAEGGLAVTYGPLNARACPVIHSNSACLNVVA